MLMGFVVMYLIAYENYIDANKNETFWNISDVKFYFAFVNLNIFKF